MVNQIETSPILLAGKGLARRPTDNFEPGEYYEIVNLDLTTRGSLVPRPPVQAFFYESGVDAYHNHIAGLFGSYTLMGMVNTAPYLAKVYSLEQLTTGWAAYATAVMALRPTVATDGGFTDSKVTLLRFFLYNGREYAMTQVTYRPNGTPDSVVYLIVSSAPQISPILPNSWAAHVLGPAYLFSFTEVGIYTNKATYYTNNIRFAKFLINDFVVHKDRLWIAINDTVYFSEAGDPTNFVPPDGGFFKFPYANIKSLEALDESIYVIADSSINVISYSTDPNVDSEVDLISDRIGGEDSTVLGDTIYTIKPTAIFAINGHNVSKLFDLNVRLQDTSDSRLSHNGAAFISPGSFKGTFSLQIESFEDGLYILPRFIKPSTEGQTSPWDVSYVPASFGVAGFPDIFKLDLETGFFNSYNFGSNDSPVDMLFNPTEDITNQTRLFFLALGPFTFPRRVFTMGNRPQIPTTPLSATNPTFSSSTGDPHIDSYVSNAALGTFYSEYPMYRIFIKNFSPDDSRFDFKKIRSLEFDLKVPYKLNPALTSFDPALQLVLWAGEDAGSIPSSVVGAEVNTFLTSYLSTAAQSTHLTDTLAETVRIGVNQRCKKFSLELYCPSYAYNTYSHPGGLPWPNSNTKASDFELSEIRVLWTPISRGPVNSNLGA